MPGLPKLISPRLALHPWKPDQTEEMALILSDPITMKYWPSPYDEAGVTKWMNRAQDNYPDGIGRMAVYLRKTGELIGDAGLNPYEFEGEEGLDIGWIIRHEFQRNGYGAEVGKLLMQYAREELRHPLVVANMPDDHPGSWKIAEKLDMKLEKTAPNPLNRQILTRWYSYRL